MSSLGKTMMLIGALLLLLGAVLSLAPRLPLGDLPGDFRWQGDGFSFHFPLMTSLLLSLALTVIANLFFR